MKEIRSAPANMSSKYHRMEYAKDLCTQPFFPQIGCSSSTSLPHFHLLPSVNQFAEDGSGNSVPFLRSFSMKQ